MSPSRRQVLKWGLGVGALAGVGAAGTFLLPPRPSHNLAALPELATRLFDMLSERERARATFDYDHPLRQFHNRGVDTGGAWAYFLRRKTRQVLVDLVHASLSETGRERMLGQFFMNLPGVHVTRLAIFGDPRNPPYQILVTGPHINLRIGGQNREGVAFGGPQVYGDQRGDGQVGLPGNVYRDQLNLGQSFFENLTPNERAIARQPKAPSQTSIEVQGRSGEFQGISIADLSAKNRRSANDLVATILNTYRQEDVQYAWECIKRNGGVDALHFADYSEDHEPGRNVGNGPSQIFRIEGPAAVFHFRGEPHLHAFVNIAMDGENPLSVGDIVGFNPSALDSKGVKDLFEEVLLQETDADLAYYHRPSVAGRLRAGTIRTGDLYNLESWRETVSLVEIRGAKFSPSLIAQAQSRGKIVQPNRTYRVATTSFIARNHADELLGTIESEIESDHTNAMLRDVAISYLSKNGFPANSGLL